MERFINFCNHCTKLLKFNETLKLYCKILMINNIHVDVIFGGNPVTVINIFRHDLITNSLLCYP